MNILLGEGWTGAVAPRSVIDYILIRSCDPWKVKAVIVLDEPVLVILQWQSD